MVSRYSIKLISEWYDILYKEKYSGEIYLELTFYSNVNLASMNVSDCRMLHPSNEMCPVLQSTTMAGQEPLKLVHPHCLLIIDCLAESAHQVAYPG